MIREMQRGDAPAVLSIYEKGLETRNATFETNVPSWESWDASKHDFCRFVYIADDKVVGWAALSPQSKRACYSGVAEVSIYMDSDYAGQGIGSKLMGHLVTESEKHNIWTLYSSIFPENRATLRLHLKYGFKELGTREKIAQLDGKWRDTLIVERRSKTAGLWPDAVVTLKEITEETVGPILRLEVAKNQNQFVAPNPVSIAEAYFSTHAWFRAIYADDTPVGFVMLHVNEDKSEYYLWRFMIDKYHQGKGYGRQALLQIIDHVKALPHAHELYLSYVPAEGSPLSFYQKLGFVETGDWDDGEKVMKLTF